MELFESAQLLLRRSYHHLSELLAAETTWRQTQPFEQFQEIDPATGDHLIKARITQDIPGEVATIFFDLVNGLRSALDHVVYDATVALGEHPEPENTKFPFADTADNVKKRLEGPKPGVHKSLVPCLLDLKPYKGGDRYLSPLNQLRNRKIHRTLVGSLAMGRMGINDGYIAHATFDSTPVWDETKGELTMLRVKNGSALKVKINVMPLIAFDSTAPFPHAPAADLLEAVTSRVGEVIQKIKATTEALKAA